MMRSQYYCLSGLLFMGIVFCGCSKKVETEEKDIVDEVESNKAVQIDPFSGVQVDPFSGNKVVAEELTAEVAEEDPVEAIIAEKLRSIIIPRLDIEDRTVEEVLDYLRLRSVELGQTEDDPTRRGMGMVIRRPKSDVPKLSAESAENLLGEGESTSSMIPELRVRNVSFTAALRYICIMTNLRCKVDGCLVISQKVPNTAWDDVGSLLEEKGDTTVISQKLNQIRLPRVDFENTSIHEAIDFLRLRSAELDVTSIDSGRKGINFVVHIPKEMETPYIDKLQIRDASFEEVLKEICSKTGMRYELDPYSVILIPKDLK
jgi:hypothetical protein